MRHINEIIIHCTATRPDWWSDKSGQAKVDEIRRWHVEDRGWNDIGYHLLIDRDGKVYRGRGDDVAGAHCKGHNANSLGVSLFGGHGGNENDDPLEHFTVEQMEALNDTLHVWQTAYSIDKVSGHNEYAAKACPCFSVQAWQMSQRPITHEDPQTPPSSVPAALTGVAALIVAIGGALALAWDKIIALFGG